METLPSFLFVYQIIFFDTQLRHVRYFDIYRAYI